MKKLFIVLILFLICLPFKNYKLVNAEDIKNTASTIAIRSSFYTKYSTSSEERKSNIKMASNKLNKTFVDIGAEFSFNKTIGDRTEKNGYKKAKIIFNGKFIEGIGGGVCQVSTTLYNAVLIADLPVTEFHAHSLPVSYVSSSFDAMVNTYTADLKFVNNTNSPLIILSTADGDKLTIKIMGESTNVKVKRISKIIGEVESEEFEEIIDYDNEYNLKENEEKIISYGKNGLISEGYIEKSINNVVISNEIIRRDIYKPVKGIKVKGIKH